MEEFYEALWKLAAVSVAFAIATGTFKWRRLRKAEDSQWSDAGLVVSNTPSSGILFGLEKRGRIISSPSKEEGHCAVFGSSGCGKTSAILIPALRAWTSNVINTCFAIDISGDISSNVSCPNKLIFEPGNPDSAPYDVFAQIDALPDDVQKDEALAQLAFLILPDEADASATARFWRSGARNMFTAFLIYLYHMGLDFHEICSGIVGLGYKTLLDQITGGDNYTALMYLKRCMDQKPDVLASFKAGCDEALMLFATNPKIGELLRRPRNGEIAVTAASAEAHNVFLVIPDDKLKLYAPLLNIITGQSLEYFSCRQNRNRGKILFALDEFASLKLDITDALRKLRKKGIRIMICTQSLADINATLGRDAHKELLSNFRYKVLMDVSEADSQEYFARLIGREQKSKHTQTSNNVRVVSETWSTEKDYAIEPTDLAKLGDHLILMHPAGWTRLKKNYYFKK